MDVLAIITEMLPWNSPSFESIEMERICTPSSFEMMEIKLATILI